ncbi:hypothetical protein [Microbacterium sp. Se63.02b]|uniref:hypothetical protein n=1 Tax=Microbacterium sp. Se63.02b TaxID=2709304 RepID=UPI0031F62572
MSDVLTIAVTALGDLEGRAPVTRSGARPGDVVAVAGELGLAAHGLAVLFGRFRDGDVPVPVDVTTLAPGRVRRCPHSCGPLLRSVSARWLRWPERPR